ncbi:MAG TPA: metal ABC transporter permease, partial [Planctomycetaceae bacterium]|nr:metal ABC transporter permease [Planctomycetaceae bacterium]
MWTQLLRFWSFRDPAVATATAGILLLAISSATLGCFIVLRRLSLLGDSLGHAVLPGVCLGFLVTWTKDPWWILSGALISALLASWLIGFINRRSRLKSDVAMGLVLSGFFGAGTVLLTRIQQLPAGNQTGLNQFLFGQASAISAQDLWFMGVLSLAIVALVAATFKELVLTSFDEGFAVAIGLPVKRLHYLLMGLTALAVVISIQAVGLVLVSAMLITPAAAALLCTDRMRYMILLAVGFAVVAGVSGLSLSFMDRTLTTGPFVVLALS